MKRELSNIGKEQVALALLLLKDFKSAGRFDIEVSKMILELATSLEVEKEYDSLTSKIPPMRIEPR